MEGLSEGFMTCRQRACVILFMVRRGVLAMMCEGGICVGWMLDLVTTGLSFIIISSFTSQSWCMQGLSNLGEGWAGTG